MPPLFAQVAQAYTTIDSVSLVILLLILTLRPT